MWSKHQTILTTARPFDFKRLAGFSGTDFFAARVRIWLNVLGCPTSLFTSRRCEQVAFVDVNGKAVLMWTRRRRRCERFASVELNRLPSWMWTSSWIHSSSTTISKSPSFLNFTNISSICLPIFSGSLSRLAQINRRPSGVRIRPYSWLRLISFFLQHQYSLRNVSVRIRMESFL